MQSILQILSFLPAVDGGQLHVLQCAVGHHSPCPCEAINMFINGATAGRLEILQWGKSHFDGTVRQYYDYNVNRHAATYGYLHILQWIPAEGGLYKDIAVWAAAEGQLKVLRWLRQQQDFADYLSCKVCHAAAADGELITLQGLRPKIPYAPGITRCVKLQLGWTV